MTYEIISRETATETGLRYFFTGDPCVKGHISQRFTKSGYCCECRRLTFDAWYAVHGKERNKISNAKRAAKLSADGKAARRARGLLKGGAKRRLTDEQRKQRVKNWFAANAERLKEVDHAKYLRTRELRIQRAKEWRDANPERSRELCRVKEATRRTRKAQSGGTFTCEDVDEIRSLQKGKCAECRKRLGKNFHIDHIMPVSRGGSSDRRNLQLLCPPCNYSKHALTPEELAKRKGRLL